MKYELDSSIEHFEYDNERDKVIWFRSVPFKFCIRIDMGCKASKENVEDVINRLTK